VISQDSGILLKISLNEIMKDPKNVIRFTGTMLMEIYSRFLGWFDFNIKKKNPFKWDIATSTKNLEHK
jgi:hypothetical protein